MTDITADIESLSSFPEKVPENIPELKLKTPVYINNKEHKLHLEQGVIVEKDHNHYRVKIISTNKEINGKCLWFPQDWIDPLPKDFINKDKARRDK
jgi:hypothetical protein